MPARADAVRVLALNTPAFAVCFAAWVMNGALVTFLVDHRVYHWDKAQMGLLIGATVLTGAVVGVFSTDLVVRRMMRQEAPGLAHRIEATR